MNKSFDYNMLHPSSSEKMHSAALLYKFTENIHKIGSLVPKGCSGMDLCEESRRCYLATRRERRGTSTIAACSKEQKR